MGVRVKKLELNRIRNEFEFAYRKQKEKNTKYKK